LWFRLVLRRSISVLLNLKNGEDRQAIALTTQIQVLSQQTAKSALEAAVAMPTPSMSSSQSQLHRFGGAASGQGRYAYGYAGLRDKSTTPPVAP
jgi:twitching motility protein PilJ